MLLVIDVDLVDRTVGHEGDGLVIDVNIFPLRIATAVCLADAPTERAAAVGDRCGAADT